MTETALPEPAHALLHSDLAEERSNAEPGECHTCKDLCPNPTAILQGNDFSENAPRGRSTLHTRAHCSLLRYVHDLGTPRAFRISLGRLLLLARTIGPRGARTSRAHRSE